jgi:hypothetical protein
MVLELSQMQRNYAVRIINPNDSKNTTEFDNQYTR